MSAEKSTTQFIGVDWSGAASARAQRSAIWLAVVRDGVLGELRPGLTRDEAAGRVTVLADEVPRTVVGLDFAFSLPRWWLTERGFQGAADVWDWAAAEGANDAAGWLRGLPEPFWGPGFRRKPLGVFNEARPELRRTERESIRPGARPQSVFQISGAGSVGAQALRGMPALLALRTSGFSIWPFESGSRRLVVEVFPRLLVRQLRPALAKLSADRLRREFVDTAPTGLTGDHGQHVAILNANQDAFDAAVSAWALWYGRATLLEPPDGEDDDLIEGRIWELPQGLPVPQHHDAVTDGLEDRARLADIVAAAADAGFELAIAPPSRPGQPVRVFLVPLAADMSVARFAEGATVLEAAERVLGLVG